MPNASITSETERLQQMAKIFQQSLSSSLSSSDDASRKAKTLANNFSVELEVLIRNVSEGRTDLATMGLDSLEQFIQFFDQDKNRYQAIMSPNDFKQFNSLVEQTRQLVAVYRTILPPPLTPPQATAAPQMGVNQPLGGARGGARGSSTDITGEFRALSQAIKPGNSFNPKISLVGSPGNRNSVFSFNNQADAEAFLSLLQAKGIVTTKKEQAGQFFQVSLDRDNYQKLQALPNKSIDRPIMQQPLPAAAQSLSSRPRSASPDPQQQEFKALASVIPGSPMIFPEEKGARILSFKDLNEAQAFQCFLAKVGINPLTRTDSSAGGPYHQMLLNESQYKLVKDALLPMARAGRQMAASSRQQPQQASAVNPAPLSQNKKEEFSAIADYSTNRFSLHERPLVFEAGGNYKFSFKNAAEAKAFAERLADIGITSVKHPGQPKGGQEDGNGYNCVYLTAEQYKTLQADADSQNSMSQKF